MKAELKISHSANERVHLFVITFDFGSSRLICFEIVIGSVKTALNCPGNSIVVINSYRMCPYIPLTEPDMFIGT